MAVTQEHAKYQDERERLGVLRGELASTPAPNAPAAGSRDVGSTIFVRLNRAAEDLQALSAQHGVSLSEVVYSPASHGSNTSIGQVSIRARMKGAFGSTKLVVAGILASHTELSLDFILIRRARSTDPTLEVDLQFTFFYGIET